MAGEQVSGRSSAVQHLEMVMGFQPISDHVEAVAAEVVDSAFAVHSNLGPGLMERIYEECLAYELRKRGMCVERQVVFPVIYGDVRIDAGVRVDFLVKGVVIIESKAVEALQPIHTAQILTYLKLTKRRLGFLINFNVPLIRDGIRRLCM